MERIEMPRQGAGRTRGARRMLVPVVLALAGLLVVAGAPPEAQAKKNKLEIPLKRARIYWEYNASANDLGVHVTLDGEDWRKLKILDPDGHTIFKVEARGGYDDLGLTELFFEGAEPSLDDVPLEELLERFPEGIYEFEGLDVNGDEVEGEAVLSHGIPAGPAVEAEVGPGDDELEIRWEDVTAPPSGFPTATLTIVGYQVIVGSFQVTLPGSANAVTVPPEYVASLGAGTHDFEVLAIDASGNQTLTEGTFTLP